MYPIGRIGRMGDEKVEQRESQAARSGRSQRLAIRMDEQLAESAGFLARDADRDRAAREKREQHEAAELVAEAARLQSELAEVEQAVEDAPEDAAAWQRRAEVYLARGRTEDAVQDYKQAVALDDNREDWMVKMWDLEKQVADEATERARQQAKRDQEASAKAAKEAEAERAKRQAAIEREEWKVDHAAQRAQAQTTTRVLQAEQMKDKANEKFKEGQYDDAMKGYTRALGKMGDSPPSTESGMLTRNACLLNRAACALKLQQPETSAEDCSLVLQMDPANVKALYRRGLAFATMEMIDAAIADLVVAAELKPDDAAIRKQVAKLKGAQAAAAEQ
jgi:tetratricopeptide (TPR) repeat protein